MVKRALLFGGVRVLAVLVAAAGFGFDLSGISLTGFSPGGLRLMAMVAFAGFVVLTAWREIDLLLQPRPRVDFDGLSPETARLPNVTPDGKREGKLGYFTRLAFKNNAKNPSGDNSTAHSLTAEIKVFESHNYNRSVGAWRGRWATKNAPSSYGEITELDKFELEANNQQAILDIGFRLEGGRHFLIWDNWAAAGNPIRILIMPNRYELQVVLAASNFAKKELWFTLNIPNGPQNDPQTDNINEVEVKRIKKPAVHRKGSHT